MHLVADSSIWIAALFAQEIWHVEASEFVRDVLAGLHQVAAPASVLTEVVCACARRCRQYGIDRNYAVEYGNKLRACPYIVWKTVDVNLAYEAAVCGRIHGLRGMDALVAATAFHYGVPLLASDNDFRVLEPALYVFNLREMPRGN